MVTPGSSVASGAAASAAGAELDDRNVGTAVPLAN